MVELVYEIASESGLKIESFSQDWVIRLTRADSCGSVLLLGYNFSVNPASSAMICQDKSATYLCLSAVGIACVPHIAFFNPGDPLVAGYIPERVGSISRILRFCEENYNNRVVLKPLKGTGGFGVVRAFTLRSIEAAVLGLFQKDYGLVVSPFREIVREIRAIVLLGKVKLMYSKHRIGVVGDGSSSLLELVLVHLNSFPEHASLVDLRSMDMKSVPDLSEFVPFEWRHNLGHGASISECWDDEVNSLAIQAACALEMSFCSVDVIEVKGEAGFSVLEVNAGVMMDSYAAFSASNRERAKRIYAEAISAGFGAATR